MENRAARDPCLKHLFKTKGLGAELDVVVVPPATPPTFIFHRKRFGPKLDEIGHAD
jgi:hypothetical protein